MKYLQIVLSSRTALIGAACSLVGSRAHAKDVLQEAYIQVDALLSY